MLGLLIWVSIAYPQISMATNKACGHMANPSWSVNAFAKHIIMHLYQYPLPVTWGGDKSIKSLVLAQPTIKPYTPGAKEYGLHFATDAAPGPSAKGITGGGFDTCTTRTTSRASRHRFLSRTRRRPSCLTRRRRSEEQSMCRQGRRVALSPKRPLSYAGRHAAPARS